MYKLLFLFFQNLAGVLRAGVPPPLGTPIGMGVRHVAESTKAVKISAENVQEVQEISFLIKLFAKQ